jgi:hypothetical protein
MTIWRPEEPGVRHWPRNWQCDALLEASPAIVSSIMGLYPDRFVARMKDKSIKWFATVTTVSEAALNRQARSCNAYGTRRRLCSIKRFVYRRQ